MTTTMVVIPVAMSDAFGDLFRCLIIVSCLIFSQPGRCAIDHGIDVFLLSSAGDLVDLHVLGSDETRCFFAVYRPINSRSVPLVFGH
jgi:hypothetical protein